MLHFLYVPFELTYHDLIRVKIFPAHPLLLFTYTLVKLLSSFFLHSATPYLWLAAAVDCGVSCCEKVVGFTAVRVLGKPLVHHCFYFNWKVVVMEGYLDNPIPQFVILKEELCVCLSLS